MDFDFSTEQEQLRDAVRRWVVKAYDFAQRRRTVGAGGFDVQNWQGLVDLGLLGLNVPDDFDGLGLGAVEAMVVMEELGRGLIVEPYANVALVVAGILREYAAPAMQSKLLPALVSGGQKIVLAHQERQARYALDHVKARAQAQGNNFVLSGQKSLVPIGDLADAYIVPAQCEVGGAGIGLFLVQRSAAGVQAKSYGLQDGARAAEVSFQTSVAELICAPDRGFAALNHGVDLALAAVCAQAVGVMDQLFALTVDYLNTRKQFGVAIGSFQALRHRIADMKMQLELARSMSYYATLKLGDDPAIRRRAVASAKVQLGQAMRMIGQQAIQLHGGIGMTDEYIASHYFKQLTCLELSYGDTLHHLGVVSREMQDTAGVFA